MWYWLILAGLLLVAEMLTGTLALLFAGLGALAASFLAYTLSDSLTLQLVIFALSLLVSVPLFKKRLQAGNIPEQEEGIGQAVEVLETHAENILRVRYRGTEWNARLAPETDPSVENAAPKEKDILYLCGHDGSVLLLSRRNPASAS
ncbi:MAG: NfeD family protein [Zoogloeaceae bacterium]|jgi:membrane protein implicated in regulation of membrane protease activity|nr:NfeD family protein [Zoogloeaceae bacterium]